MDMLHDSERIAHLHEEPPRPEGETSTHADFSKAGSKRERPFLDDMGDLEPQGKSQSSCKLDSQAAKLKANREKQRRAQLNLSLIHISEPTRPY